MADPLDVLDRTDPLEPGGDALDEWLTATARVRRNTESSDGAGGMSASWATVATLACRLWTTTQATEAVVGGQVQAVLAWHAMVPAGSDVRIGDRLQVDSVEYEVTDTDTGRTDALALVVQLRRLRAS